MALDTYMVRGLYSLRTEVLYDESKTAEEWSADIKRLYGSWPATVLIQLTPEEFFELIQIIKRHITPSA